MKLTGNGTSKGVAIGKISIYRPFAAQVCESAVAPEDVQQQIDAFYRARESARAELIRIMEKLPDGEEGNGKILAAHIEMIYDESILDAVTEAIGEERCNACWAIDRVCGHYRKKLLRSKDELIRERAADVDDIRSRLIRNCQGIAECNLSALPEPVLIAAHDLLPSDTAAMDVGRVLGISTEIGGMTSHSAIIARSYGIPQIAGIEGLLDIVKDGMTAVLDADRGELILEPDEVQLEMYSREVARFERQKETERQYLRAQPLTADGVRVDIGVNIGSAAPNELQAEAYTDFVGLFRTEFLYMERDGFPTEDEQFERYRAVLRAYGQRPVTLRTLDIGGDKTLPYFCLPQEQNPFLGCRALRLCLKHPQIFRTQLRAALRASVYGNLWIMIPMVGSMEDIAQAKAAIESVKGELRAEGIAYSDGVRFGVMIEIPSLAMIADAVAAEVDFASIGSNDLCQYLLAADRMNPAVQPYYQSYHPALFRLMGHAIAEFNAAGKPIGICGELGGDGFAVPALIGLGLRKLSMNAAAIGKVKRAISHCSIAQMEALAQQVLRCSSAKQVEAVLGCHGCEPLGRAED